MKFTAQRKEFLSQARRVYKVAPRNHTTPELNGIHIEAFPKQNALRLTATDFEMSIRVSLHANVELGGETIISARLLIDILNKLPGDEVVVELRENNMLKITSGVTSYNISVLPGEKYPRIEMPMPGETIAVSSIPSLIGSTVFAASKESIGQASRAQLCCVNLVISADGIRAVASDGFCVAESLGDRECEGDFSMMISASAASTLAALANESDVFQIGVTGEGSGKTASFYDGSLLFTARLVNGEFFDSDKAFDSISAVTAIEVDAQKLRELVANATAVATDEAQLEVCVGNGKLTIRCVTLNGKSEASIPIPSATAPEVTFYFSPKRLENCLKTYKGAVTLELSKTGVLLMRCGNARYFQIGERKRVFASEVEKAPKPAKKAKTVKTEKAKKAA